MGGFWGFGGLWGFFLLLPDTRATSCVCEGLGWGQTEGSLCWQPGSRRAGAR